MRPNSRRTAPVPEPQLAGGAGSPAAGDAPKPVAPVTAVRARLAPVTSFVEALRPRQWVKNLLVGAAPLAAAAQFQPHVLTDTLVAFVAFTFGASGTYLVNDVRDRDRDRLHPVKRQRPVARGEVAPGVAGSAAVLLLAGAVALPLVTGHGQLAVCMATYVVLMQAYSLGLKDEPVLDLAIVASGFLLRAMAGGLAAGLPLSRWFLMVAVFGSLFMVSGKRYSELVSLGSRAGDVRASLEGYTPTYLRFVWTLSAGVLLTAYCLWAFEVATATSYRVSAPWSVISVAPFVLGVLRYALDVDRGEAAEPESIVLHDRALRILALLWLLAFSLGAAGV